MLGGAFQTQLSLLWIPYSQKAFIIQIEKTEVKTS